ncbi:MAG: hypothetical protein JRJ82_09550 [Deltaproteobacteria bacterium]|nr:hypothetical protein [Deltaproteobacteria bacterium]
MNERHADRISERFSEIVSGTGKGDILVAIFNTAPFLNVLAGVELRDYYMNVREKLRVQLRFQDAFPDFFCFPGIWADYGALGEPSAFGCNIEWPESGFPMAQPVLKSMGDVASLKPIDPLKDGLMPKALEEFQYMWDHLDHRYMEEYGYLEGVAMSFGPVELAAVIMGYGDFYLNLRAKPEQMHGLLEITTESVLRWLKAQEKINGRLKRIGIADHVPGQISQEHFEEFWLPYSNRVVEEFPAATIIYHNEYPVPYLDALAAFKFHVWHFGGELAPAKAALGTHRTLMGNLHPIHVLLQGSPEEIYEKALACLKEGATGGRFLLSSGGGLAPDTPIKNLKSLESAWKHFMRGED